MKNKQTKLIKSIISPSLNHTIKDIQQFYQNQDESNMENYSDELLAKIEKKIEELGAQSVNHRIFRYYVISPPIAPKRLNTTRFRIGRDEENDLALTSIDVSRFHCEIVEYKGQFVLIDNNSANGSFINNDYIDFHVLKDGDKVYVGSNVLEFRVFEVGDDTAQLTTKNLRDTLRTTLRDKKEEKEEKEVIPRKANSFSGDLEAIQLYQVLQILALDEKSGCLKVDTSGEQGIIYLIDGLVVSGEYQSLKGIDAILEIVSIESGTFQFDSTSCPHVEMTESVEFLLLEYAKKLDENQR